MPNDFWFYPLFSIDFLKPSYFTEAFKEAFEEDLNPGKMIINGTGSGLSHALEFILMGNKLRRKIDPMFTNPTKFIGKKHDIMK